MPVNTSPPKPYSPVTAGHIPLPQPAPFVFGIGDRLQIEVVIAGRAAYAADEHPPSESAYLIRFTNASGVRVEEWIKERTLRLGADPAEEGAE